MITSQVRRGGRKNWEKEEESKAILKQCHPSILSSVTEGISTVAAASAVQSCKKIIDLDLKDRDHF